MSRFLFAFVSLALGASVCGQTTLYVDDDGCPNPGTGTPADPLCRIQRAIELANAGDEIVVAPGTYNELVNFFGKAVTLRSSDGPEVTIIDAGPVVDSGAGKPVVRCDNGESADTVLDGFTLTGGTGKATKSASTVGGGMFNFNTSPTVTGCIFTANTASEGGGMFNFNASPTVTGCTFEGNTALWRGGGMANRDGSEPTVIGCTFTENGAALGGGMHSDSSNLKVSESTFAENTASESGAGMFNRASVLVVTDCRFDHNSAALRGGGMYNESSNPIVTNSIFVGNNAQGYYGGGMLNSGSNPTLANCIFNANIAPGSSGGGIGNLSNSQPILLSCTFTANAAGLFGGGIWNNGGITILFNCIVWNNYAGNSGHQIYSPGTTIIRFSSIEGSGGSAKWSGGSIGTDGGGNIDANPQFVDANGDDDDIGTVDDDLRLSAGSPAIDAGFSFGTPFDLDGNIRIVNDPATPDSGVGFPKVIDMGAYEFGSSPTAGLTDLDGDGDVDVKDYALFVATFTGPTIP